MQCALAGVPGGLECHPLHQKVGGSTVGQGTWVVGSLPSLGAYGRQLGDVSLSHRGFSLSLFPFLSLSKINKCVFKNF